jgi:hypothetical protein
VLKRIVVHSQYPLSLLSQGSFSRIGLFDRRILEKFNEAISLIEKFPFKILLPKFPTKIVVVGDLIREIVTHEIALRVSETSFLPVRSFGLEEFFTWT